MLVALTIDKDNKIMFTVIGCLGSIVAETDSTDEVLLAVQKQIPIGKKKMQTLTNALARLSTGREYHVEYGGSGITVRRS